MKLLDIIIIAVGLSMDAFAVSVCKGLAVKKVEIKHILIAGLYFGLFQAVMPLIGYFAGVRFKDYIESFDHWITFALLAVIGAKMIYEALKKEEDADGEKASSFGARAMLPLAVATSIDALAVGVSFAFLSVNIFIAIAIIGAVTFCLSGIGVKLGNLFGSKYKSLAEIIGGSALILIGVKILIEHLFFP